MNQAWASPGKLARRLALPVPLPADPCVRSPHIRVSAKSSALRKPLERQIGRLSGQSPPLNTDSLDVSTTPHRLRPDWAMALVAQRDFHPRVPPLAGTQPPVPVPDRDVEFAVSDETASRSAVRRRSCPLHQAVRPISCHADSLDDRGVARSPSRTRAYASSGRRMALCVRADDSRSYPGCLRVQGRGPARVHIMGWVVVERF